MKMETVPGLCPKGVWNGWRTYPCNRPIKNKELGLCGMHASHRIRTEKREAERRARWAAEDMIRKKQDDDAKILSTVLGVEVTARGFDRFVVPGEWLRRIANR